MFLFVVYVYRLNCCIVPLLIWTFRTHGLPQTHTPAPRSPQGFLVGSKTLSTVTGSCEHERAPVATCIQTRVRVVQSYL